MVYQSPSVPDILSSRFNPYYAPYGFELWPGGLARNPYNYLELEPYTGMVEISDYIQDLQYPHMLSLALDYGSEIMVRQHEVGTFLTDAGSSGATLVVRTTHSSLQRSFTTMLWRMGTRLL